MDSMAIAKVLEVKCKKKKQGQWTMMTLDGD
jgi:hypothetical protein